MKQVQQALTSLYLLNPFSNFLPPLKYAQPEIRLSSWAKWPSSLRKPLEQPLEAMAPSAQKTVTSSLLSPPCFTPLDVSGDQFLDPPLTDPKKNNGE